MKQDLDVVAVYLQAHRLLLGYGGRLVRRLFEHRGESEEFAVRGLIDHDFLISSSTVVSRTEPDTMT